MSKTARDVLTAPPPDRKPHSRIEQWMREKKNGKARAFVDEWLKLRAAGETEWGIEPVIAHLRKHHSFPYSAKGAFARWLTKYRPEATD